MTKRWIQKRNRKRNEKLRSEFLPSALEIVESPPSPLGAGIIFFIFGILLSAILWASIGEVDEVAVARGKIVPDGRLKVVQPLAEGIVTGIFVEEGQSVRKGQLLFELDAGMQKVDESALSRSLQVARIEKKLLETSLQDPSLERLEKEIRTEELPQEMKDALLSWLRLRLQNREEKKQLLALLVLQAQQQRELAAKELAQAQDALPYAQEREKMLRADKDREGLESAALRKIRQSLEILKEEEERYRTLHESGAIPRQDWLDKKNAILLQKQELQQQSLRAQKERELAQMNWQQAEEELERKKQEIQSRQILLAQAESKWREAKTHQLSSESLYGEETTSLLIEKQKQIEQLEAALEKAQKGVALHSLTSPVSGVVQGISLTTVGGVVTPAQPIMSIVPEDTPLRVEAFVLNKDIGFVHPGQKTGIKIDTFSFQRYGILEGTVESVSPDAFEDEKLGLVYRIKVRPAASHLMVEGREIPLSPGMAVTVEVKTGKRRIIEFFLEPLVKYMQEGLQVR
ncbi:MAG: HlyD family type I secretion periplasmic adaptor subunit [Peptostreptococcaceae bacterium]|nr:HlyD family type I secretion periplasmic adaptor subunit [Peptostreptococcaceae bacterium]